jgi:NADH-quinone oxidoreductase subunit J
MSIGMVVFAIIAIIATGSALGLLLSRNTVYAALFLIINFVSIATLYFFLGAPFIALAQITIYAGSIMVLFLFVIMLLGTEKLPRSKAMPWQKPLAIVFSALLLIESGILIYQQAMKPSGWPELVESVTSPTEIGLSLFNQYLLPFEITSVILLAAVVGAIYLTRPERIRRKTEADGRSEK